MGLIKAAAGAIGGTLADQWKDYFYCDAIDADTLVVKGSKRGSDRSSNTKGESNVISDGDILLLYVNTPGSAQSSITLPCSTIIMH